MDHITDTIAVQIKNLSFDDRQELLETPDLKAAHVLSLLTY